MQRHQASQADQKKNQEATGEKLSILFLFQSISMAIKRGNKSRNAMIKNMYLYLSHYLKNGLLLSEKIKNKKTPLLFIHV